MHKQRNNVTQCRCSKLADIYKVIRRSHRKKKILLTPVKHLWNISVSRCPLLQVMRWWMLLNVALKLPFLVTRPLSETGQWYPFIACSLPPLWPFLFPDFKDYTRKNKKKSPHISSPGRLLRPPQHHFQVHIPRSWDLYRFMGSGFSAFAVTEPGQGVCCGPAGRFKVEYGGL